MFSRWGLLLVLGLTSWATAKSSTGDSVLVILEPKLQKDNFSIFFDGLRGMYTRVWVFHYMSELEHREGI